MSFIESVKTDMYSAMKRGEKDKAGTLRILLAKLKDKQIQKKESISEQEAFSVIKMLVKQRKESIKMYEKANRIDLKKKESAELKILEFYLPKIMDIDETRHLVKTIISETGASSIGDIGIVMPKVMQCGSGRVDGKVANNILRELLS
ncbi:MAG: glutamyl-tRNA amidotransferase [Candidatus Marinimicrobia bacterium]|nr:glutamyl-tRNA amidotransferase [Candidatus Neomarinimicrobiota bacterium]|tara:strand:+ start:876 stop:1319 length:444 start_codon:yes stop_codon:yes gene_type:complete